MQTATMLMLLALLATPDPLSGSADVRDGETVVRVRAGASTVVVKITAETRNSRDLLGGRMVPGFLPERTRVVKELQITRDGQSVHVPRGVFLDLLWIRSAEVLLRDKKWLLVLAGGDGAESFFVEVEFDKTSVLTRRVFDAEFSDAPAEETRYFRRVVK